MKNSKLLILIAASLLLSCGNNSSNSSSSSESSKNQTETVNTTEVDSTIESSGTTTETTTVSSTESSESSTESTESSTESSESSTESSSSTTEEAKYTVNFVGENVNASLIGTKEEFASGEEVMFNYSVTYGYKVTSFTIKDASGADVEYAESSESSLVTFTMPASNVTVSFFTVARHTLSLKNGEHSSITVTDKKDYYDEGNIVNFTVTFEEGYELDTLKVYKVVDGVDTEITYQTVEANYSFAFVDSNMKIVLADKAKPVSSDPFTVKTTYQSDEWLFPNGYYNYYMYLRVVFNGDMTLSWYLTFNSEYYEGGEDWAYIPPKRAAVTKPNDMPGEDFKDGQENLPYAYDQANEKTTFTTKINSSDIECSIKLNKEDEEVKTITFETQMGDEYYQTGNRTLKKI